MLTDDNARIGRNDGINGKTEKGLAVTVVELADELDGVRLMVVILYLGLNEDAVAGCVIPNMDAEGVMRVLAVLMSVRGRNMPNG